MKAVLVGGPRDGAEVDPGELIYRRVRVTVPAWEMPAEVQHETLRKEIDYFVRTGRVGVSGGVQEYLLAIYELGFSGRHPVRDAGGRPVYRWTGRYETDDGK